MMKLKQKISGTFRTQQGVVVDPFIPAAPVAE
jgi:hypothetical protein